MRPRLALLTASALAFATVSCASEQPILDPRGPAAKRIADLGIFALWVFGMVALVMWILIFWVAIRRRGSFDGHEAPEAGGGTRWIVIGGFAIPAVILGTVFVLTLGVVNAFPMQARQGDPQLVVTGHQWWWQVEYTGGSLQDHVMLANELHIPVGKPVDIELRSADVMHSFWAPQLHGKVDLLPGQKNFIRIQADHPGRYRGECAEFCGAQHAHMALWIIADSPERYALWLDNQRHPAVEPTDSTALAGETIFQDHACILCHTVRGTAAQGSVGPDLTHLASRQTIAAGSFPNDRAHLSAWVTHAQSLKPLCQMPDMAVFKGSELGALVDYLQQLR